MIRLPPYFLPRPKMNLSDESVADFERLFDEAVSSGPQAMINYSLSAPKWQFLCYVCERKGVVLHGSGAADIGEFEPRKADDIGEFGNRRAVYAASDGIWPIYFAIANRENAVTSLVNGCFRVVEALATSDPHYFFSINADAFAKQPWRDGVVYLLPDDSFEPQPLQPFGGAKIEIAQWASPTAVKPLAKLVVAPEDFPFLTQVRSHDFAVIQERARVNPDGFPWLDE